MKSAETLAEPLHPTVLSALQDTPVAPLLGQPVQQVLAGMGLPALPQFPPLPPLPGLPPLPPLDPAALVKPITDLFSGFGNGKLSATGALNPQTVLQNVTQAVNTAMQLVSAGIQLLQSMDSPGARAATAAATDTYATSGAIAQQAAGMHLTMGGAAESVATGYVQMAAVAARFALTSAALGPTLATPPGQAALLATALETGTEAVAITAHTKAKLGAHATHMTKVGDRVPTRKPPHPKLVHASSTPKPTGTHIAHQAAVQSAPMHAESAPASTQSSQSVLQQLFSELQQVIQPLMSAAQQIGREVTAHVPPPVAPVATLAASVGPTPAGTPSSIGGYGGLRGAPTDPAAAPLGQWQADGVAAASPRSAGFTTIGATTAATVEAEALPPIVPLAGAAAMGFGGRARPAQGGEALVDARHGDELVGAADDDTTAPVIGGVPADNPDTPFSL
ncbi:hypothetical protein [Nocardia sp. NPDC051570]|uniref:hypothetical protein n=1 Tax=Nocardia sp. NPDC051570 TaxID=3364324 RepID=UPI0037B3D22D